MTKSNFKFSFRFLILVILCLITTPLFIFLLNDLIYNNSISTNKSLILLLLFAFFLPVYTVGTLIRDVNFIKIYDNKISFRNIIGIKKEIQFNELDGYITMIQFDKGGAYEVIYLVQNGKFISKITSYLYSNFIALKVGLDTKYIGDIRFTYLNSMKILFGIKVLN